jgi:biopolymer transport protein ExbD
MHLETGYEGRGARLEMIPLMDVIFLLLIFFIYAMFTMVTHRGVQVDLPQADGRRLEGDRLVITLTPAGTYQLDGRDLSREDVVVEAVDRHRGQKLPVLISADRKVPLGLGIELLAQLQQAGVDTVTFQVTPEKQP